MLPCYRRIAVTPNHARISRNSYSLSSPQYAIQQPSQLRVRYPLQLANGKQIGNPEPTRQRSLKNPWSKSAIRLFYQRSRRLLNRRHPPEKVATMEGNTQRLLETRLFHVIRREQQLEDGTHRTREIICHPGAVTIIPIIDDEHVCLIRNFRISVEKTLIELPAGTLEPGEDPAQTAIRELEEETGFQTTELTPLNSFFLSPGILNERMHLFVATNLTAGPAQREPGEQIENYVVTWDQAMKMACDGTIQDAKTLVGLLLYDQIRR